MILVLRITYLHSGFQGVILYFNDGIVFLTRPWECSCMPIVQPMTYSIFNHDAIFAFV